VNDVGVVVIGRNEGERLIRALKSPALVGLPMVYIDSGSTDGSLDAARTLGVEGVALDLSIPFTAARARNAGFERLIALKPDLKYVQFIDGDCEVVAGWIETARMALDADATIAIVAGRRRERFPERSVYNRLCDIEWDTPIGEAGACGGDILMRVDTFLQIGGYDASMAAGEDVEICIRARQTGKRVMRIDAEMTLHDAAMTRFGQWWTRAKRCGFAYALGAHMHGQPPERHFVKECRRVILWGFLLPLIFLAAAWWTYGLSLLGFCLYVVQAYRIARRSRKPGMSARDARAWGFSCAFAKFPEFAGWCRFHRRNLFGQPTKLIEYK
jgi:GT2 family glycosyltransferase